jgi:hypothetical protein
MSGSADGREEATSKDSLAQKVFTEMSGADPLFDELRSLLLQGRRSEAIKLICKQDQRFGDSEAQELVSLVMNTLRDTAIEP